MSPPASTHVFCGYIVGRRLFTARSTICGRLAVATAPATIIRTASACALSPFGMQSQYPSDLVRPRIAASPRTPVRPVPSLVMLWITGLGRSPQEGHAGKLGDDFLQKLQSFSAYLRCKR